MNLQFEIALAEKYKNPSQIARVLTEDWGSNNLYCPSCSSPRLQGFEDNKKVIDYICPACEETYQMKSTKNPIGNKIMDSAYQPMIESIKNNKTPHLILLNYDSLSWSAQNLLVIPKFFLTISCIEKRKPLSPTARRAGWVGCNIVLQQLPTDGRIFIIKQNQIINPKTVREHFAKFRFLENKKYDSRGWTADVLKCVREIGKTEFTLDDVYAFEKELKQLHPQNYHVKDKIRQQLQILRDQGILDFIKNGNYSLI